MLERYERLAYWTLRRPGLSATVMLGGTLLVIALFVPFLGRAYFPRTDPGQFIVNVKMPSGTRIELSNEEIGKVEAVIRQVVSSADLGMIVSNIGITPDLSAIYTPNSAMDTAFVQVSLKEGHKIGSYEYISKVRDALVFATAAAGNLLPSRRFGGFRRQPRASSTDRYPDLLE
jgi:multidrug efflux pump subunit AcrB